MYLTNPSTSGQIYVADAGMVLKCNTNDPIFIKPNDVDGLTMNYDGTANFSKTVSVWNGISGSHRSSLVTGNTVSNLILTNPTSNTNLLVQLEPTSGSIRYDSTTIPLVVAVNSGSAMQVNPDRTISCTRDLVINTWSIGDEFSLLQLASRDTNSESSSGGALNSYATEQAVFYGGVKQGGQYLKGGAVNVVRNKYRPVYRLSSHKTSQFNASPNVTVSNAYMSYNSSPSASYIA
jgi:hypothetical protein